jgi:hypothetical protein
VGVKLDPNIAADNRALHGSADQVHCGDLPGVVVVETADQLMAAMAEGNTSQLPPAEPVA